MKKTINVPVMVTMAKEKKDKLKRIVSAMNLKDPDANKTVSGLSREIIELYIESHSESQLKDLVAEELNNSIQ